MGDLITPLVSSNSCSIYSKALKRLQPKNPNKTELKKAIYIFEENNNCFECVNNLISYYYKRTIHELSVRWIIKTRRRVNFRFTDVMKIVLLPHF